MDSSTAIRAGAQAHAYLQKGIRDGRIVSTFRHGFNILFDEVEDPGYVAFQSSMAPFHPWAVELATAPHFSSSFSEADAARSAGGIIQIEDFVISIAKVEIEALHVPSWSFAQLRIAKRRVGFVRDALADAVRQGLESIVDSIAPSTQYDAMDESLNERVREYVGLGEGSTPMGDDYIVGQLAPLWATRDLLPSSARQIKGLRVLLRWEELLTQTTLPSAQMLLSAANGHFAVPTLNVIQTLSADSEHAAVSAASLLAAQGATSGMATLHGLFNALSNLPLQ